MVVEQILTFHCYWSSCLRHRPTALRNTSAAYRLLFLVSHSRNMNLLNAVVMSHLQLEAIGID